MSHYHAEIIIPPTDIVTATVSHLMAPFQEENEDEDADERHAFWDFWTIGGRWSGSKMRARIGKENIDKFWKWCADEKLQVSSVQAGKQELVGDVAKVDAKWSEMFPEYAGPCPLFANSGPSLMGDTCRLDAVPPNLEAETVIFGAPEFWEGDGEKRRLGGRAVGLYRHSFWNGVNHQDTTWDGNVLKAVELHRKEHENYAPGYVAAIDPKPDWLVVTVDYHS